MMLPAKCRWRHATSRRDDINLGNQTSLKNLGVEHLFKYL
jgi:hypothetical protein